MELNLEYLTRHQKITLMAIYRFEHGLYKHVHESKVLGSISSITPCPDYCLLAALYRRVSSNALEPACNDLIRKELVEPKRGTMLHALTFMREDGLTASTKYEIEAKNRLGREGYMLQIEVNGKGISIVSGFTDDVLFDAYTVTGSGLCFVERFLTDESGWIPDELVTLSQVEPLTGRKRRTLERYVKDGKIRSADFPGGGGKASYWYWHHIREDLNKITNRELPMRFPGSRLIN